MVGPWARTGGGSQRANGVASRPAGTYQLRASGSQRAPRALASSFWLMGTSSITTVSAIGPPRLPTATSTGTIERGSVSPPKLEKRG